MSDLLFGLNQLLSVALLLSAWWLAHRSAIYGGYLGMGFAILFGLIGIIHGTFLLFRFTGTDLAILTVLSKAVYLALLVALINVRSREPKGGS